MILWNQIIIASIISYVLRIIPILAIKKLNLPENGWFIKYLDYTICALMGGMIYTVAFPASLFDSGGHNIVFVELGVLLLTFYFTIKTKNILYSLLLALVLFVILMLIFQ